MTERAGLRSGMILLSNCDGREVKLNDRDCLLSIWRRPDTSLLVTTNRIAPKITVPRTPLDAVVTALVGTTDRNTRVK